MLTAGVDDLLAEGVGDALDKTIGPQVQAAQKKLDAGIAAALGFVGVKSISMPSIQTFSLALGIDIHIHIVPPGVPTPLPNPYIGILFDLWELLFTALAAAKAYAKMAVAKVKAKAQGAAAAAAAAIPLSQRFGDGGGAAPSATWVDTALGWAESAFDFVVGMLGASVIVNNVPRGVAGSATKNIPHIPYLPLVPPPANEGEVFMGSSTVQADGDPMSYMPLPALDCWAIGLPAPFRKKKPRKTYSPQIPSAVTVSIPLGRPVLVGGPPTISLMGLLTKLGVKALKKGFGALIKRWKKFKAAKCLTCFFGKVLSGNPIDLATGKVARDAAFLDMPGGPGAPEINFFRLHQGGVVNKYGIFGPQWSDSLSERLTFGADGVTVHTAAGREILFDDPYAEGQESANLFAPEYRLRREGGVYALWNNTRGTTKFFGQQVGTDWLQTEIRDDAEGWIRFTYESNTSDRLTQITRSDGFVADLSLNPAGRLTRVTVFPGKPHAMVHLRCQYDEQNRLIETIDAAGYREGFAYDDKDRMVSVDYNGAHTTRYLYDDTDRVIATRTSSGHHNADFEYRPSDRQTVVTDAEGGKTLYEFNDRDLPVRIVNPLGGEIQRAWGDGDTLIAQTDANGLTTETIYDAWGEPVTITAPDGTVEAFERDGRGRLLSYTDAVGAVWFYERDGRGNVTAEIWPDGRVWRYGLNGRGQPERITNPDGTTLELEYDARHRLARWTDALGAQTTFAYDAMGRLRERVEPDGTASTFSYDAAGRLTAATLADGRVLSWAWSARGDLIRATDGEGKAVTRDYGPYGLLEQITDPKGGTIRFERDKLMRLTGVYNELGERYSYVYDAAGRVMAETDFSGRTLTYAYDIAGRLTEKTAGDGIRTTYAHDRMDRLTQVEIFDRGEGTPPSVTRYAYDPRGLMTEAQNRDATVALERDILGRVTRESVNGRSVESTYNDKGELAARDFDGRIARYAYDANGLMSALAIGGHAPLDFERDIMGRERMRRSGAGFAEARLWDRLGQLRAQAAGRADGQFLGPQLSSRDYWDAPEAAQGGAGVARSYSYDRAFNPTEIVDARWGAARYDYDANDQITKAAYEHAPGAGLIEERFTYDAARNISAETETTRGASLSLGEAEPTATTRAAYTRTPGGRIERRGDTTYAYDDQGRMVSKRVERNGFRPQKWRYDWDGEDQLRRVHTPDEAIWEYSYDPFGRRIGKRCVRGAGGKVARDVAYLWAGNLLSEERRIYADGTEQTVAYHYEQGSFRPIAQEVDGTLAYIVTDHLGTPKELLTEDGELLWSAKHELWGKVRAVQHTRAANDNAGYQDCLLRFQGQIEDEETGLYYNRFRYYDPASGNYCSSDPMRLQGGNRVFSYVSSPTRAVDYFGLNQSDFVGTTGTYSSLHAERKRLGISGMGDGVNIDHIPSKAAQLRAAEIAKGGPLTAIERTAVIDNASSVVVNRRDHLSASRTYGGRNNADQIAADANDIEGAIDRDLESYRDAGVLSDDQVNQISGDLRETNGLIRTRMNC